MIDPSNLESSLDLGNFEPSPNDLPIAFKKENQSCTLHLISKFVSYDALFPKFHTFIFNLDRIKIPKHIDEAWEILE